MTNWSTSEVSSNIAKISVKRLDLEWWGKKYFLVDFVDC